MDILIIGSQAQQEETKQKFGNTHQYMLAPHRGEAKAFVKTGGVIFDFTVNENQDGFGLYQDPFSCIVFLDTTRVSLHQLGARHFPGITFGFCGLPGFLNRPILEVSTAGEESLDKLKIICAALNTDYRTVADRVGLVTPRVICMIINEAYYTVEEGTATREDIDLAMKLGTNYPFGPFEWCRRIGVRNVWGLLDAVNKDTGDERYKPCSLLDKEYRESLTGVPRG